jgi:S1-C subfamily serine protease
MKKTCRVVLFSVLVLSSLPAFGFQAPGEMLNAVVKIHSIIPKEAHTASSLGTEREGNGVVIDAQGHILTTGYLITEAETIEVMGPDGKAIRATFVGYDHHTGFGLLRANQPLGIEPLKLGESSRVKEGDPVLVAGYGGVDSVTAARVISRKEFTGYWEYILEDAIYTSPPHANFGGTALIGRDGRLLGIGSLFAQLAIPEIGLLPCNVFIPIDLLQPILHDLITNGRSSKAPRPWLGINSDESHGRVFVNRVTTGGPAEKAGLQPGDLILTVKGAAVNGLADFYRKVWALGNAGVDVPLSILRETRIRDLTIRSADRYQFLMLKPKKMI